MAIEKASEMSFKEQLELAGACVRWGALAMGGICFLIYTHEMGQFPEGLNLSGGLAFYVMCAGFWIIYSMYFIGITATGCLLVVPIIKWIERKQRRNPEKMVRLSNPWATTDLSLTYIIPVATLGAFGLFFLAMYVADNPRDGWITLLFAVGQGMFSAWFLLPHNMPSWLRPRLIVTSDIDSDRKGVEPTPVVIRRPIIGMLFFTPLIAGPHQMVLVDAAFRFAKLRKDNATIHVEKPWSIRVSDSTLQPAASFLGENHTQFKNVKVLLRSVGEKVVIELPQAGDIPSVILAVPSSHIVVE